MPETNVAIIARLKGLVEKALADLVEEFVGTVRDETNRI